MNDEATLNEIMYGANSNRRPIDAIGAIDANSKVLPGTLAFPIDAMPKECRRLIREASDAMGCPPEMVALPMLATLGSAIGNTRRLKVKGGYEEGATVYAAVIAEPGEKKSPAQAVAVEPAMREQARLNKEYKDALDEHEQELRRYEVDKKDAVKAHEPAPPPPQEPVMERTVVGDTTTEALAVILQDNPRGVLVNRDELAGWVRGMDQYKPGGKGSDRQYWLTAWTNHTVHIDRKGQKPIHLTKPFSCVAGSMQPDMLPELSTNRDDGMFDRFLYAYPEPVLSGWTDAEISETARGAYSYLYKKLRTLDMEEDENRDPAPRIVEFSTDARACYIQAVDEHYEQRRSPGFPRELKGAWAKLEGYLGRMSLILAVCRYEVGDAPERVEASDVLMAAKLLEFFKNQAYRTYTNLHGRNPDDAFAYDLAEFLAKRDGTFEGTAGELHEQLRSTHKPKNAQWLSVKLEEIAKRSSTLTFERDTVSSKSANGAPTSKRVIRLTLEIGVNGANGVNAWRGDA